MSILVTGSAGQLGAELCRLLGAEATGVDIDTLDLTDRAAVLGEVRRLAPARSYIARLTRKSIRPKATSIAAGR